MASVKPFFLSNFFFFVQFMAFTFATDTTTTKANTDYPKPLERTAPITEIKNKKAAGAFFSEKWKTLDVEEDASHLQNEYAGVKYAAYFSKIEATLNVWQPYVAKYDGKSSLTQLKVYLEINGTGDRTQIVEAGWRVKGHGEKPRFYVYCLSPHFSRGCVNLKCGDFRLANASQTIIDAIVQPISTYGGQQYDITVAISKEVRDSNTVWAVYLQGKMVGFYPESTFKGPVTASQAEIGGLVTYMSKGRGTGHSGTDMGSGHYPSEGFKKAAYIRNVHLYGGDGCPISNADHFPYANNANCYDVDTEFSDGYFFYGGPGGKNKVCKSLYV